MPWTDEAAERDAFVARQAEWNEGFQESIQRKLMEPPVVPIKAPAASGVTLGHVTEFSGDFNATYTIEPLSGAIVDLPGGEELIGVIPQGRMFDTGAVDFHNAAVGSPATIHPLPLEVGYAGPWWETPDEPLGGCLQLNGNCQPRTSLTCDGVFLGVNSPCALVYLTEFVKISVCPTPPLAQEPLPPPPIITQIAGFLT